MNDRIDENLLTDVQALRIPPHSIEAEQSVLGSLLLDNYGWDRVGDLLAESDFYRHEHKLIFATIGGLINASKPADVITVFAELEKQGKASDVGGLPFLHSLAQVVLSSGNIRRYAEIVRERAVLRKLIAAADEIAGAAFNVQGREVDSLLDDAMQKVMAISPDAAADDWVAMESMVVQEIDLIADREAGGSDRPADFISTGLADLDDMLDGGLRPGQLIIVGARPSMGKSAFADTIGIHVAQNLGLPVGKFSMEMQNHEGGQRAISAVGRIPLHALRRPERMSDEHWGNLTRAVELLRQIPFYSNDKGGLNINQIRAKARALKRKRGLKLLLVDYLQLMAGTDPRVSQRTYQLEEASRGLKALAKELGIPVVALAQVGRGVEKEADPMPRMSDLKDCGAIEQDADIILFIDRPYQRKPDLEPEWKYYARALLAKQRGGRTGYLDFTYVGEHTRFMDWPRDMPVPTSQVRVARSKGAEL